MNRYMRNLVEHIYMRTSIYEWKDTQFEKNRVSAWRDILEMIDEIVWVHKKNNRIYALCTIGDNRYVYIKAKKCPYGISMNTYIKMYISRYLNTILDFAMSESVYRRYHRDY